MKRLIAFVRTPPGRAVAFLVAVFVVSRIVVLALGFHFDLEWVGLSVQNIDPRLLQHRLAQSLWYLHGQPPLWNAILGLSLKTGVSVWPRLWHVLYLALGLIEALAVFALLLELGIPRRASALLAAAFSITPAVLVTESMLAYEYPTLVILTLTALAAARYARNPSLGRAFALFALAGSLVLMRTLFEWPWLLLVLGLVVVARPRARRTALLGSLLPIALVAAVIAKNWIMFGVPSTTSWSGMMLARSAVTALPLSERRQLVAEGKLNSVALVPPNSPLADYLAVGVKPAAKTGIPMLDERGDEYFPTNMENKTFIRISRLYLHDDLWIMRHRTGAYLRSVSRGVRDFFASPTINLQEPGRNTDKIRFYDRWFNRVVYGTFGLGKDGVLLIALYMFALGTGIVVTLRRFRPGADEVTVLIAFSLLAIVYLGLIGNLAEVGDNDRFRFYLDPLALATAAYGIRRLISGRFRAVAAAD